MKIFNYLTKTLRSEVFNVIVENRNTLFGIGCDNHYSNIRGLKKLPSWCPGQVNCPAWQVTFSFLLAQWAKP